MSTSVATAEGSTESKIVYILTLESRKYYVGATAHLESRIETHRCGSGARWTQEYSVIEVAATSSEVMDWKTLEKEVTLRMMKKYGWENVRGGPWTQVDLSKPPTALRD